MIMPTRKNINVARDQKFVLLCIFFSGKRKLVQKKDFHWALFKAMYIPEMLPMVELRSGGVVGDEFLDVRMFLKRK